MDNNVSQSKNVRFVLLILLGIHNKMLSHDFLNILFLGGFNKKKKLLC
jgi:hypothetical protein